MGNDTSNPVQNQSGGQMNPDTPEEEQEDIYIMEDLANFSLKGKRQSYFWVDPKIFNSENQKY